MSPGAAGTWRVRRDGTDAGQAQIELIAVIPAVICVAAVILQLLAVGYAQSLADGSAEAGAYAIAAGGEAEAAVRGSLPDWAARRARIETEDGRITVSIAPPSLLAEIGDRLSVDSSAWVRPAGEGG